MTDKRSKGRTVPLHLSIRQAVGTGAVTAERTLERCLSTMTNQDRKTAIRELMARDGLSYTAAARVYAGRQGKANPVRVNFETGEITPLDLYSARTDNERNWLVQMAPPMYYDSAVPGISEKEHPGIRVIYDVIIQPDGSLFSNEFDVSTRVVAIVGREKDAVEAWADREGIGSWSAGYADDTEDAYMLTGHQRV